MSKKAVYEASTYRELFGFGLGDVESLSPEQLITIQNLILVMLLDPMNDVCLALNSDSINYLHRVTRNKLVSAMVWLATSGEIFGAVHPVYAEIDMLFVAGANFEYLGDPVLDWRIGIRVLLLVWLDEDVVIDIECFGTN